MTFVGVDPAFRKYGMSACMLNEKSARFFTYRSVTDFIMEWIVSRARLSQDYTRANSPIFIVENSNLQNTTFYKDSKFQARISRNVGANQAASQIIIDLLKVFYTNVYEVSPKQKGSKLNDKIFRAYTDQKKIELVSYRGKQDERDAFKIADMGNFLHIKKGAK